MLVNLSGMDPMLATWEDIDALKLQFPFAPAWRQVVSKGWGNVRDKRVEHGKDEDCMVG